jgi:hypothetical protein
MFRSARVYRYCQAYEGAGHQRNQPRQRIQRLERNVSCAVVVRRFELVTHFATGGERHRGYALTMQSGEPEENRALPIYVSARIPWSRTKRGGFTSKVHHLSRDRLAGFVRTSIIGATARRPVDIATYDYRFAFHSCSDRERHAVRVSTE